MKFEKIVFILSVIGILILGFLSFYLNTPTKGIVESVEFSQSRVIIKIVGQDEKLIVFENRLLDIKEGDEILFWGKREFYRNESQIIVERIEKITD